MILRDHITNLVEFYRKHPEYGGLDVCYSSDDEGNNHCKGVFGPEVGIFDGNYNGDFTASELEGRKDELNCVRIN